MEAETIMPDPEDGVNSELEVIGMFVLELGTEIPELGPKMEAERDVESGWSSMPESCGLSEVGSKINDS